MKKSLLALAVASLAASSVASAATIYNKDGVSMDTYGRIQSVAYSHNMENSSNLADRNYNDNGALTSGRLGFDFRSDLGYGIAGIAKVEWDVADNNKNAGFVARHIWVGLDFGAGGKVMVGRMNNGINLVNDTTDIFEDQGANAVLGDERRSGLIGYEFSSNGFDLRATYQLATNGQDVGMDEGKGLDLDSGFTIGAGYTTPTVGFGPIAFRAGYSQATTQYKDTYTTEESVIGQSGDKGIKDYDQYALGLAWGSLDNGLYLGTLYNQKTFNKTVGDDIEYTGYEAVVAYGFTNGLSVKAGYNHAEREVGDKKDKFIRVPLLANYAFNANFNVWAETSFDGGSDDKNDEGTKFSAGMRYSF